MQEATLAEVAEVAEVVEEEDEELDPAPDLTSWIRRVFYLMSYTRPLRSWPRLLVRISHLPPGVNCSISFSSSLLD